MIDYKNAGGNSTILAYEIGEDTFTVKFKSGKYTKYTYSNEISGKDVVDAMKSLAPTGQGLNAYISMNKPKIAFKR